MPEALVSSEKSVLGLRMVAFLLHTHMTSSLCEHTQGRRASSPESLLRKALISFIRALLFPKAPPPNTITLMVMASIMWWWGGGQVALVVLNNLPVSAGDIRDKGWIPGLGRSPGSGHGNPLQYSCLQNPHGQTSLAGYSTWGCRELDMTGVT